MVILMDSMFRGAGRVLALLGLAAGAFVQPAAAIVQPVAVTTTFFGEDLNGTGVPLVTHPNAAGAAGSFFADGLRSGTETFDGIPLQSVVSPLTLQFAGTGVTGTLTPVIGPLAVQTQQASALGIYPVSGTEFLGWGSSNSTNLSMTLAFSSPILGFGFYGIGAGDFAEQVALDVAFHSGALQTFTIPHTIDNNLAFGAMFFEGLTAQNDPIDAITFRNVHISGGFPAIGLDNMTVQVPEPATIVLVGLGIAGLVFARRKHGLAFLRRAQ